MQVKKLTKVQLFNDLKNHMNGEKLVDRMAKRIINEAENYKDLKELLAYYANKFYSIREQIKRNEDNPLQAQWYHGETYRYSKTITESKLYAIHLIAQHMNYEIYSPNGYWFIKSY